MYHEKDNSISLLQKLENWIKSDMKTKLQPNQTIMFIG
jgi:hypothetical protein